MTAGRELDTQVAEKVMGWRAAVSIQKWVTADTSVGLESAAQWEADLVDWSPSTDIVAAWDVLMRLRQLADERKLWGPGLTIHVPLGSQTAWVVRLKNDLYGGMAEPHTDDTIWRGTGESAPHAICLAALAAVAALGGPQP